MNTELTEQEQQELAFLNINSDYSWRRIGKNYYQTDEKEAITLEIHKQDNIFRWFLYASDSPDPDTAVTMEVVETLEDALSQAIEATVSWIYGGNKQDTWDAYNAG